MWPCLYALCGGHETKKRLHFVLYVRQPHIKSQWGDVLFVNQREGEIHGKKKKNQDTQERMPVGSKAIYFYITFSKALLNTISALQRK